MTVASYGDPHHNLILKLRYFLYSGVTYLILFVHSVHTGQCLRSETSQLFIELIYCSVMKSDLSLLTLPYENGI